MANPERVVPPEELAAAIWRDAPSPRDDSAASSDPAEPPQTSPSPGSEPDGSAQERAAHKARRAAERARQAVRWHIHRLRQRVEPEPASPAYILNVYGKGYTLGAPGEE